MAGSSSIYLQYYYLNDFNFILLFSFLFQGTLKFKNSGAIFNLEDYGDGAIFSGGIMSELATSLEVFLNSKGYQMIGVGARGFFDDWFKTKMPEQVIIIAPITVNISGISL